MRLFVAINLPGPFREELAALIARLKRDITGPKWVRAEGIHLTLRFLGEVGEAELPRLLAALSTVADGAGQSFTVHAGGLGLFPDQGRPRVLWIGLHEATGALVALQGRIESAVRAEGLPGIKNEDRSFRPHLTLARLDDAGASIPMKVFVGSHRAEHLGSFEVSTVTLFRSILGPGGARYDPIQEYRL